MLTSLVLLAYQARVRPFEFRRFATFEAINEATILLLTYILIPVSWTTDGPTRELLGTLMINLVMLTVGLNVLNFIVTFIHDLYTLAKKLILLVRIAIIRVRNWWRKRKDLPLLAEPHWPYRPRRPTVAAKPEEQVRIE